jgi:hypothetical protein
MVLAQILNRQVVKSESTTTKVCRNLHLLYRTVTVWLFCNFSFNLLTDSRTGL